MLWKHSRSFQRQVIPTMHPIMTFSGSRIAPCATAIRGFVRDRLDLMVDRLEPLSPTLAAYGDWCQSGYTRRTGPMNDQPARQQLVRDIAHAAAPQAVIETGTHRGATTGFLWAITGSPTWTVESSARYVSFARWRLRDLSAITVCQGDSRAFLRQLAADRRVPKETVFFYLDAHWGEDLPLREELVIITHCWSDPIIMIDDFEVPGDPGYGFDDYGNGKRLTRDYLPWDALAGMAILFPSCPSSAEGGLCRGCSVVVSRARAEAFARSHLPLRPSGGSRMLRST